VTISARDEARLVSIHGGHSGAFCHHAQDSLEAIVLTYIRRGFDWIGVTEHMPPLSEHFLFADERAVGLTVERLHRRFRRYMEEARRLEQKYREELRILVGFEAEWYTGSMDLVEQLVSQYRPDYIVGSVHHVDDMNFDYGPEDYRAAVRVAGSPERLYCRYFDQQHEMITALRPEVVGHFDLIRIYDPDYRRRLELPEIWSRIRRNLDAVRELGLILDFNVRALGKGASEPYVSESILRLAVDLGIDLVPGDDSHGVATAGQHIEAGVDLLARAGARLDWRQPQRRFS
jgi:histidinol-phosphatase (PHP family)